jgi:hypothetical protein
MMTTEQENILKEKLEQWKQRTDGNFLHPLYFCKDAWPALVQGRCAFHVPAQQLKKRARGNNEDEKLPEGICERGM